MDHTDSDFAIAVALSEGNEVLCDDDFKPSVRKAGFNQQHALNACRLTKKRQQQHSKKQLNKKDGDTGNGLVEDFRGEGRRQKNVRKQATKTTCILDDSVKQTTSRSMAELDSFRYTGEGLRGAHALREVIPVMEHELNSPVKSNYQKEIPNPDQINADKVFRSDSAADHADEFVVIDLDTDEVVELCDENQFSVLLRLCGEECEQDEFRTDAPDVDRFTHLADGTLVNSLSKFGQRTTFGGIPGSDSMEAPEIDIASTNLELSIGGGLISESAIAPSTNIDETDLPAIQEGIGVEEQSSQDQFSEDAISSMMTQKCPEEINDPHGFTLSPLQNISNLPARLDTNVQLVTIKSTNQAPNGMDSKCMNSEDAQDANETIQLRRPGLQVHQLEVSREELVQNRENIGDSPCDIIVVEHPSVSEHPLELSVRGGLDSESAIAPSTNIDETDLPAIQEGIGVEEQSSQDQFCEDAISSMMTQKCPEEVNDPHGITLSPLQNISNLPARLDTNMQLVTIKSTNLAANGMDSKCMNSEDAQDTNEIIKLRGPGLQVHQLEVSREELVQNKENICDSPCDIIIVEHPSVSGHPLAPSPVREGHNIIAEDVLLYAEEIRDTIQCPVCGENISGIAVEERLVHTNFCLDKLDTVQEGCPQEEGYSNGPSDASDEVKDWLDKLNLSRYVSLFVEQEIDRDTLPWLTEEDLMLMGINAIGPRRKIFLAIQELKRGSSGGRTEPESVLAAQSSAVGTASTIQIPTSLAQANGGESNNPITNYFPLPTDSGRRPVHETPATNTVRRTGVVKNTTSKRPRSSVYQNTSGIPPWMCIPGTPFRVDAFQHLNGDCSYWFLTHFHTDHYQGLTRGFRFGHIFCSSITARLVNLRIGVSWEKLMIIPLHEKVKIAGVDVTFIDANHCPGSVMILFEPPNGEAVLHTGDFRFCPEMAKNCLLQTTKIHTLVLDTTYCDPQYDFPPQDTVIRFVIEAIQAEMFNSDTLFLIGTYTIGKERIFLEVGKVLKKYVYIAAPKKKLLDCMDLSADDTKWLTCNEQESFIHVVPLWSISSFKRMTYIARNYQNRYKLIVAFSPTGWSFGRGKKKTPGKRWKQGTMIRYEVPYSEHCSFQELRDFLRFIGPEDIIPSVPGKNGEGADAMIASLLNEDQ